MSREIKFRAWDKQNKKWLLGYQECGGFNLTGECVILGEFSTLFRPIERINEIEIMQYTGFKDSKGKEIYEGDLLQVKDWSSSNDFQIVNMVVEFIEHQGAFMACNNQEEKAIGSYEFGQFEIIGNVFENPKLAKEKQ